jgi:hypothetical protein
MRLGRGGALAFLGGGLRGAGARHLPPGRGAGAGSR